MMSHALMSYTPRLTRVFPWLSVQAMPPQPPSTLSFRSGILGGLEGMNPPVSALQSAQALTLHVTPVHPLTRSSSRRRAVLG